MTELDESRQIEYLEDILLSYAFTIEEKLVVTRMAENNARVIDYIIALADGLKYGNWPWIKPTLKKTLEYRQMAEGDTTRSLMNHRYHPTSCPAYAGNEFTCDCGMVR